MHIYIYIYRDICICMYMYIYTHIYYGCFHKCCSCASWIRILRVSLMSEGVPRLYTRIIQHRYTTRIIQPQLYTRIIMLHRPREFHDFTHYYNLLPYYYHYIIIFIIIIIVTVRANSGFAVWGVVCQGCPSRGSDFRSSLVLS